MKKLLLALCIPLSLQGAAAKKEEPKVYTHFVISYASLESLQAKVNAFLKKHQVVVQQILWKSEKRAGVQEHKATIMFTTK